jgi:hypothetical protein
MTIMTGSEIFKRTAVYEREASSSIRLHAPQWKLLLTFDGQRALSEVALTAGMPFSEALNEAENFLKHDWIAEQPISLDEYLKRASGGGSSGSATPPPVPMHEAKPDAKVEAKPEPKLEMKSENGTATPATTALPSVTVPPAKEEPAPVKEITPIEIPVPAVARRPMRLSAIVDYIISLAESIPLGQLLAYRIFLRVPPEILQSEDIVSIHLVDDTSVIRTEALQKAIATAVHEVVRRPLPESVFAPA